MDCHMASHTVETTLPKGRRSATAKVKVRYLYVRMCAERRRGGEREGRRGKGIERVMEAESEGGRE